MVLNSFQRNKKARKQVLAKNNIKVHTVQKINLNLNDRVKVREINQDQIKTHHFLNNNAPNLLKKYKVRLLFRVSNPRYNLAIENKTSNKSKSSLLMMTTLNKFMLCAVNNNTT